MAEVVQSPSAATVGHVLLANPQQDMAETQALIRQSYPAAQLEIHSAHSFNEIADILKAQRVDFIVLDIAIAVHHSTLDMMQMIQQAAPDVPLLIFTHQQNAVDALSLIQAGAQDYMIKGRGDHQTLRRIFQYSLERYRYQKALQEANSRLEARIRDRTAELEHALQLANDLNREKTLVFANLTHELRTPLHAILNFSDFAREKYGRAPDEKILGYLDRIHKSGTRLLTLVDDILDLNKLKSEGREKHFEPTDLLALTEEALRDLQSLAEKRHIHTNLTREGENFTVSCNPHKIMQVLVNLLSNAYKFTPEHTEVAVQLEVDDNRKLCRLSVIDQGPGIPEEDLRSVFDEFSQSQKVNSGAFIKGTGLGLAICKEIINHHHGNMWAENQPGGGAKLSFELPIRQYGRETSHQQADEAGIA